MSRFSRSVRIAVAGLLAVSAVIIFGASPASAATGSLVDDGNGGLVVTYSSPAGPGDYVVLEIHTSGSGCSSPASTLAVLANDPNAPQLAQIAASPVTIVAGSTAFGIQSQGAYTLAATSYTFCLMPQTMVLPATPLAEKTMTLGQGAPTTTSTTAPSTTTTAAADPVAPAFTG
jgi:hypothetical protein